MSTSSSRAILPPSTIALGFVGASPRFGAPGSQETGLPVVEYSLSYSGKKEPGHCQLIHRGDQVVSTYISRLSCLKLSLYSLYLKPFLALNLFHLKRYYHIPIIQTRSNRVILEFPFSLIPYIQWTTKFYTAVLSNIGCHPRVATEYLKRGWTKLRCA